MGLELKNLYDDFRDGKTIKAIAKIIEQDIKKLNRDINIMEVCGGHTHTIMKYGLPQILPEQIILYMGRAVLSVLCQKIELTHAYLLAMQPDTS